MSSKVKDYEGAKQLAQKIKQETYKREGLTWNLIGSKINIRYLPSGYILDSGCPCAFLRDGVADNELYFIMGWLLTDMATNILKEVLNHTRNIQGKDIERLPYPVWAKSNKRKVVNLIKKLIEAKRMGHTLPVYQEKLNKMFDLEDDNQ